MNNSFFEDSIILIGPSGAGKSTVASELSRMLNFPRLCLDTVANHDRDTGVMNRFNSADEYNAYLIRTQFERAKEIGLPGIVDFGAGHSVYDNMEIFNDIKDILARFKNVVLLLPSYDLNESIKILAERSTGDYSPNMKFLTSPCNKELATITIVENGKAPIAVAEEILNAIHFRKENKK